MTKLEKLKEQGNLRLVADLYECTEDGYNYMVSFGINNAVDPEEFDVFVDRLSRADIRAHSWLYANHEDLGTYLLNHTDKKYHICISSTKGEGPIVADIFGYPENRINLLEENEKSVVEQ